MLNNGFFTALGTPVDEFGNVIEKSLAKQIVDQQEAGASGLLLMGSMGMEPYIRESEYSHIVAIAVDAARGKCPLFVGAMDNSVWRVRDKLNAIGNVKIDGIVVTTPYYYASSQEEAKAYFKAVADASKYPVYLYDLPVVTKTRITRDTVLSLMDDRRIAGIKSGDLVLNKELINSPERRDDFSVFFSTLDLFDAAYIYGIRRNLDGMFSCTPNNASKCYEEFAKGNFAAGAKYLENIISLRNLFVNYNVFPSFTAAMNLLGYEGSFSPDYMGRVPEKAIDEIREKLQDIGEI